MVEVCMRSDSPLRRAADELKAVRRRDEQGEHGREIFIRLIGIPGRKVRKFSNLLTGGWCMSECESVGQATVATDDAKYGNNRQLLRRQL